MHTDKLPIMARVVVSDLEGMPLIVTQDMLLNEAYYYSMVIWDRKDLSVKVTVERAY